MSDLFCDFNPTSEIQELRRIYVGLNAFGVFLSPARETHAFLKALPGEYY